MVVLIFIVILGLAWLARVTHDWINYYSLFPTELAVLNIDTAVMDTPRIVNSAIRVQLVSQIK